MVKNIKNGRIIHILNNYGYNELLIIKSIVQEIGNKEELDAVNKYILIRKLEGESWWLLKKFYIKFFKL